MYIPLTYWESQADTLAQTNAKFFVGGALATVPQTISYNYETSPFSYTFTEKNGITNICQDTIDQSVFYRDISYPGVTGLMSIASQPYFCSANVTQSTVPCNSYLFYYDSIGCGFPGSATARYYDCSGNLVERLVSVSSGVNTQFTACATSFGSQPCILTQASTGSCTSSLFIPSTCCVQTPPNTGPEAWYIDIKYVGNDNGTFYFYYINQYGDLVNDTITFAQGTKRIVSQTAAFWIKNTEIGFTNFLNWNLISKFPGQVIPYKYKDLPAKYIFTLKRTDPSGLGVANFNNYWYQTTGSLGLSGSLVSRGSASVGTKLEINSYNLPLANSAIYYNPPNGEIAVYPTSSLQYNIQNCQTSLTTSVDLQSNISYSAGTVIKVNDPSLTGCWSVLGFASRSFGIADYYTTINSTYTTCTNCFQIPTGSVAVTSSLVALYDLRYTESYPGTGSTIYDLSGKNNNATIANLSYWNYNTSSLSTAVLMKNTGSTNTQIDIPEVAGTNYTLLLSWYGQNRVFDISNQGAPLLFDKDQDPGNNQYGITSLSNDSVGAAVYNGTTPINLNVTSSATLNAWHISQISLNTNGTGSYCLDGITGSYTGSGAYSALQFSILGNVLNQPTAGYGSGSILQVAAVYTSSLSTSEMLSNYNALKNRYGI
jgi:hypothetical protein